MSAPFVTETGDNPYTLKYRDVRVPDGEDPRGGHYIVIGWEIEKPECLAVSVTKSDSLLEQINVPVVNENGAITGYEFVWRRLAQTIKITLDCGECTCGGEFTATVKVRSDTIGPRIGFMPTRNSITLSITCAGPGCTNTIKISAMPVEDEEPTRVTKVLTSEEAELLLQGEPIVIDPGKPA